MRDAISLLELCAGNHTAITESLVESTVGSGGKQNILRTVTALAEADYDTIFGVVDDVVRSSKDITVFWSELLSFYRDMLVFKTTRSAEKYLDLTDSERESLEGVSRIFTKETLLAHCRMLDDALYTMQKAGTVKRIVAEMTLVKMIDQTLDGNIDSMLSRISKLENALSSGVAVRPVAESPKNTEQPQKPEKSAEASSDRAETVPPVEAPPAADNAPAKPIRGWGEIAARAIGTNGYLLPFLKMARGYITADKKISVRFSSDFALEMIEKAGIKATLCAVINTELQASYKDQDIRFEVSADMNEDSLDDLDSFDS